MFMNTDWSCRDQVTVEIVSVMFCITCLFFSLMFMATDWSCKDWISVGIMLVINNHYLSVFQLDVHGNRLVLQGLDLCGDYGNLYES